MTDLDDQAEIWFGVSVHDVDAIIHMDFVRAENGEKSRLTMDRQQAYWIAERLITAIATLDARNAERANLDEIFKLQPESPRRDDAL